ncbi:MAG: hypothetical protein ACYTGN_00020 [Planctomycetota bacterium]
MSVRIDEPAGMNVLGLFLAASLRRLDGPCPLRGALAVESDGMRATVSFEDDGIVVTRRDMPARATLTAPLALFVDALVRPRLATLLRIKVRGSRLFAIRAFPFLRP